MSLLAATGHAELALVDTGEFAPAAALAIERVESGGGFAAGVQDPEAFARSFVEVFLAC